MEKNYIGKDYMVIQFDGTPLAFTDFDVLGEIVIYGDIEEAQMDYRPQDKDMGIATIYYSVENGKETATITKPNSKEIVGSFTYDDNLENFQLELKAFLKEHPFC